MHLFDYRHSQGLLLALFLINCGKLYAAANAVLTETVQTDSGPVVGIIKQYNGSEVSQFLGIPFAEPPMGDLRFRKPLPKQPWKETYGATAFQASCMQYIYKDIRSLIPNLNVSEDCLHLNVFVPGQVDRTKRKAVMVWIHGGWFLLGQATMYDASYLTITGDVIVVTVNYRLGLFGFLSTEDEHCPGNYGLWDQVLAIKWVHNNIRYFGGDSSNICIFGESAGGYSVGLHTQILSNRGHFQRAICESGTVLSPRALAKDTTRVSSRAGSSLGCSYNSSASLVQCLRSKTAEDILKIQNDAINGVIEEPDFVNRLGPVIDGELIKEEPLKLMEDRGSDAYKFFSSLDIMIGSNSADGGLILGWFKSFQDTYNFNISDGISRKAMCREAAATISRSFYNNSNIVTNAICNQYDIPDGNLAEIGMRTLDIYSDTQFFIPAIKTLDIHSSAVKGGRSYQYLFSYQPAHQLLKERPAWLLGANHADELPFVFGQDIFFPGEHFSDEERMLTEQTMKFWSNFAKTGNPNKPERVDMFTWPEYDAKNRSCMNLSTSHSQQTNIFPDRVAFWLQTMPPIMQGFKQTKVIITNDGPVSGLTKKYGGKLIDQYLGIPYAEPPVNDLRFRKPVPVRSWSETYLATSYPQPCMQVSRSHSSTLPSEDCLYLNVFVPTIAGETKQKAVMVWIHGGAYITGSSSTYDASYLTLTGDVIVVTINYRLGLLGFLSTGDENSPGNYGLWDQVLAIKWVHDNIQAFGGDKTSICVFGESAGGYSVGLHMVMPVNKGRFNSAICQSGTVLSPRALAADAALVAERAGKSLDCNVGNDSKKLIDCLREKPAKDLIRVQTGAYRDINKGMDFLNRLDPVIDGELITDKPQNLINDHTSEAFKFFNDLNIIVGSNNNDGSLLFGTLQSFQKKYGYNISEGIPRDVLCNEVAEMAARSYFNGSEVIAGDICKQYEAPSEDMAALARHALNVYGDLHFMFPTIQTLDYHDAVRPSGSMYQYIFTHQPSYSYVERPPWSRGANHAEDLAFVFGLDVFYPQNQTKPVEERALSTQMMLYWSNFAKTGNPNTGTNTDLPHWPSYDASSRPYMNLSLTPTSGHHLYADRVDFWTKHLPDLWNSEGERGGHNDCHRLVPEHVLFAVCFLYVCVLY